MSSVYPLSLIELLEGSEILRALNEKNALQIGDVLSGRVVKLINSGEALIDFGRFRARALVQIPLSEGERLSVTVLETGDKIRFQVQVPEKNVSVELLARSGFLEKSQWVDLSRVADFIADITDRLTGESSVSGSIGDQSVIQGESANDNRTVLSPTGSPPSAEPVHGILTTLTQLKELVKAVDLHNDPHVIASKLNNIIQGSGLFWEGKLLSLVSTLSGSESMQTARETIDWNLLVRQLQVTAKEDVKQQINTLINQVRESASQDKSQPIDRERLTTVRTELETFIDNMASQHRQIFEEIQLRQENQAVFSFTLPFEQTQLTGKLKLYVKKGKSRNRNAGWRISLLLNLTRMGGVRVDFYYLPQTLRLTVFVLDRFLQNELLENSESLIDRLRDMIDTVHFEVLVSKAKIDHFEAEDWLDDANDTSRSVDIKA